MKLLNAPNLLSFARLPLAVAFWALPAPALRVAILAAAALTDWLDGWLARRRGGPSPGGELIDPIFDKIFVVAVAAALLVEGRLAPHELALIVVRDVLVLAGTIGIVLGRMRVRLRARPSGKAVTVLQVAALFAAVIAPEAVLPPAIAAASAGVVAAVDYALAARRSLHGQVRPGYDPAARGPAGRDGH